MHFLYAIFGITIVNILVLLCMPITWLTSTAILANAVVLLMFLKYYYTEHQSSDRQYMTKPVPDVVL